MDIAWSIPRDSTEFDFTVEGGAPLPPGGGAPFPRGGGGFWPLPP
jgi:hypothetical protein